MQYSGKKSCLNYDENKLLLASTNGWPLVCCCKCSCHNRSRRVRLPMDFQVSGARESGVEISAFFCEHRASLWRSQQFATLLMQVETESFVSTLRPDQTYNCIHELQSIDWNWSLATLRWSKASFHRYKTAGLVTGVLAETEYHMLQ